MRALAVAFGLVGAISTAAVGQRVSDDGASVVPLDTVQARLARGDYAGARSAIDAWWGASGADDAGMGTERARALLLRARLTRDLDAAESDYLAVVLGYPSTPYAADALLRLGQGLLAVGSSGRAVDYLDRFRIDFPDHRRHAVGLLWLARAQQAVSDPAAACSTARSGIDAAPRDPRVRELLEREADTACAAAARLAAVDTAGGEARDRPPAVSEPAAARADTSAPAEPADPPPANARYTVQTGAFRYERGAESLAARLRRAGYRPRLVYVPGSTLLRVRVGRFERPADASALARRIRGDGFAVVVVRDAHRERER